MFLMSSEKTIYLAKRNKNTEGGLRFPGTGKAIYYKPEGCTDFCQINVKGKYSLRTWEVGKIFHAAGIPEDAEPVKVNFDDLSKGIRTVINLLDMKFKSLGFEYDI